MAQNMWLSTVKICVFLLEILKILTEGAALILKGRLFHYQALYKTDHIKMPTTYLDCWVL